MDLCNHLCFHLASWHACQPSYIIKALTLDVMGMLLNQIFFIPAMLIGINDIYSLIPHSVTLTLAGFYKVSAMKNLLASFSHYFSSDQDEIWCDVEAVWLENPDTTLWSDLVKQGK